MVMVIGHCLHKHFGYHYTSSPILILSKITLQNTWRATLKLQLQFLQRPRSPNEHGRRQWRFLHGWFAFLSHREMKKTGSIDFFELCVTYL